MMNCEKTPNGQTLELQNPDKNNVAGNCFLFGLNGCSTVSESNARVSLEGKNGCNVVDLNVGVNVNDVESRIAGGVNAVVENKVLGEKTVGLVDSGGISSKKVGLAKNVKDEELKETVSGARKVEVCGGNISLYVDFSGSMGKPMNCSSSIVGFPADSSLPEKSFGESLIAQFESLEFLTQIKELSLCVSEVTIVDLAKMKNHLAGFYRFIGHLQLPVEQIKEPSDDQNDASDLLIANRKRKIGESELENHEIGQSDFQSPAMAESAELRERKKSKYLMFPFVGIEGKASPNETSDADSQESGPPKVIALPAISRPSSKSKSSRFQKQWARKFVGNNEVSSNPKFIDTSVADLCSELFYMAEDCQYPKKCENFDIIEWFFSKFRIFAYHDESPGSRCEGLPQKESQGNKSEKKKKQMKKENSDVKEKPKRQKQKNNKPEVKDVQKNDTPVIQNEQKEKEGSLPEPKSIPLDGVSIANMNIATDCGFLAKENSGEIGPPTPNVVPAPKKRKRQPKESKEGQVNGIPDLNGNLSMDNSALVKKQKTERKKKAVTADVNSSNSRLSTVSVELKPSSPIAADTSRDLTKEGVSPVFKPQIPGEKEGLSVGSPTSNPAEPGTTGEPPKKRRRRTKTTPAGENGEANNEESRGTALLLTFSPGVSLPSKEILESTFCRFGQLREAETLLAKDVGLVQVVFVKNNEAEEAVKSLESCNPFEGTLAGHRLKVLPVVSVARKQVKVAPKAKVAVPVLVPVSQPKGPPFDVIRRNLEMMTKMLEKSGDSLSPEMRTKLEGEIEGLKKKVNSLPGSSCS